MPAFTLNFTSIYFPAFVLVTLLVYYLVPKRFRYIVLLVASIGFFVSISWKSIFFLAFTILSVYGITMWLEKVKKDEKAYLAEHTDIAKDEKKAYKKKMKGRRKWILALGIVSNLAVLIVMKYTNFFITNINGIMSWFNVENRISLVSFLLPLGISFYTFQAVGYMVDVYWNKYPADRNFLHVALFLSFFPKIVQGPILRYDDPELDLYSGADFNFENIRDGFIRMGWGYFKKLVIADTLMAFLSSVFADMANISGIETWCTIVCLFVQDYCDFSGYMDIVIGLAQAMGIKLPENFNHPYFAKGIDEYWRRWHMTLGAWFKDYVFIPLSVSRFSLWLGKKSKKAMPNFGKKIPGIFGLIVVWFLTGFWHGAEWRYIIWGLYFGVIIIIGIVFEGPVNKVYTKLGINPECLPLRIWRHVRTLLLLAVGKLFFFANDPGDVIMLFSRLFSSYNNMTNPHLSAVPGPVSMTLVAGLAPIVLIVDIIQEKHPETTFREKIQSKPAVLRYTLYIALFVCIIWAGYYGEGLPSFSFGYAQF